MTDRSSQPGGSPDAVRPGDVIAGKYRIARLIGRGGMGVVLEAWHLQLEERIAIKLLAPELIHNAEAVGRFQREAAALFKIKSAHVCRVLDVGQLGSGLPYIVMEYLEGSDLGSLIAQRRGIDIADAVDFVVQACEAVGEAHVRGVVHRDIKPDNIVLCRGADGSAVVKVLDFGLSKIAARDSSAPRVRSLTSTAQAMGTPHYMSPEQWTSARDVGPETDQWAFAVMLYELICGQPPFDGEQLAHICTAVLTAPMPSLAARRADVPPALEHALRRALEKQPAHRHRNLGDFAMAIAPFGHRAACAVAERTLRMFEQADLVLQSHRGSAGPPGALPPAGHAPAALPGASGPLVAASGSDLSAAPLDTRMVAAVPTTLPTVQTWLTAPAERGASSRRAAVAAAVVAGALVASAAVAVLLLRSRAPETAPTMTEATAGHETGGLPTSGVMPSATMTTTASAAPPASTTTEAAGSATASATGFATGPASGRPLPSSRPTDHPWRPTPTGAGQGATAPVGTPHVPDDRLFKER